MIKRINKNNKALRLAAVILCAVMVLIMIMPTTAHASSYTLLKYGSTGSKVTQLQQALYDKGYLSVTPTGYYGSLTKSAVINFQSDNGLTVDGIAGDQTQTALYGSGTASTGLSPTVKYGSSGWAVTDLQNMLEKYGYYNYGSITGYFGSVTRSAVVAFQQTNGLTADGIVGPATWRKLYSSSVVYAASSESNESISDIALAQNGKAYVLGGNGPDVYDCSGLAYYAITNAGYSVDRLSASAYSEYSAWTKISSTSALKKGNLVFFKSDTSSYISHMGIYIGDGQFVHASSGQGKVMVSDISNTYWARNFVFARRVS